jgi:hypothetical protein
MNHRFARNACLAVLMSALLVLASGCSTQKLTSSSAPQLQTSSVVESRAMIGVEKATNLPSLQTVRAVFPSR